MTDSTADTHPDVALRWRALVRVRSGEQRLRMACEMFDTARRLVAASLPDTVDAERELALLRRFYGRELDAGVLEAVVARRHKWVDVERRGGLPGASPSRYSRYNALMAAKQRVLTEEEREQTRRWLDNWTQVGPILEAERAARLRGLTDDDAWHEAQGLLSAWESEMAGDAGEGLLLHQRVFARWPPATR